MKQILSAMLCTILALAMAFPAFAAEQPSEIEAAAAYVREQGIMVGDQNGNLNLDAGLNRAELAVLLTRLRNGVEELFANTAYYERGCKFADVPAWARPYVGYCVRNNLVAGYDALRYGAGDPVNPAAACTVMFRACGIEEGEGSIWNYQTASSYAAGLGWIDETTARADIITRGEMAVLIYRTQTGARPGVSPSTGDGLLSNGRPVTEGNVLEFLRQIERDWPTGTVWGTRKTPGTHKNEVACAQIGQVMVGYRVSPTYGCSGYASMVSSLIFGDKANPARRLENLSQIRPGDVIFMVRNETGNVWHVVVALESPNEKNAFHITDGNAGETVQWPDNSSPYSNMINLDCYQGEDKNYHLEVWTRYPEDIPYTGGSITGWTTGK